MKINLTNKKAAHNLFTTLIIIFYLLFVFIFESVLRFILGYDLYLITLLTVFITGAAFVPVRNYLQNFVDRIFFHRTIEHQNIIKEITRLIVTVTDLKILFHLIEKTIIRTMGVKKVYVLLYNERESNFVQEQNGDQEGPPLVFPSDSPIAAYLEKNREALALNKINKLIHSKALSTSEKEELKNVRYELECLGVLAAIPSFTNKRMAGIILLKEKLSGESFSLEDLDLLLTMASEAAIAIENAKLYRDITETRDYLNNLIQGSDDAILTLELNGRVLSWNEAATSIFGNTEAEVLGNIPPFFTQEEIQQLIGKVLHAESVKAIELRKANKNGKEIPLLLTLSLIRDTSENIVGISAILKDITELRKADHLKSELLTLVSHELRTPLTPINGYLALLLNEQTGISNPEQRQMLLVMQRQSQHLKNLIDSVIDISRIEAGKPLALNKEPIFCEEIVKESVEACSQAFKEKGVEIKINNPQTPLAIMADRIKLIRVLDNLLSNALKFSPERSIVWIFLEKEDHQVKISVGDAGIGIDPQNLEKIFEGFFQVDTSYTRNCGGIGMGLTIASEIVNAHGGRIWAESEGLGKGARFCVALPIK
jgi:PAS domain S-box-containing protein